MKFHYVYILEDPPTGEFYIGSRTCRGCSPEEDEYMGSYCCWKPEDEGRLVKRIISSQFKSRVEANAYEKVLIESYISHKLNKNAAVPTSNYFFCINRGPLSEEHKQKISKALKGRKLSNEHKQKISEGTSKAMKGIYKEGLTDVHKKNISKGKFKRFKHIPTGKVFSSGKEAAKWAGLKYSTFKARIYNDRDCNEFEALDGISTKSGDYTGNKGRLPGNARISLDKAKEVKKLIDKDELGPTAISRETGAPLHVVKDMKYRGAYEASLKNCS